MAERNKLKFEKNSKKSYGSKSVETAVPRIPYCQFNGRGKGVPHPEYSELMGDYLMANFGEAGLFWKTDHALVISEVTVADLTEEYPDMSNRLLLKLFEKRIEKRDNRIEKLRDELLKIFGIILLTITEEGRDFMMRRTSWTALQASRDPLELKRMITQTHSVKSDTANPATAKKEARDEYYAYRQSPYMSLLKYSQGFRQRVENLGYVGCTHVPDADEQAIDFIGGLDDSRYWALKTHLTNEESLREMRGGTNAVYPNSLDAAIAMVSAWKSTGSSSRSRDERSNYKSNSASAFATSMRDSEDDTPPASRSQVLGVW